MRTTHVRNRPPLWAVLPALIASAAAASAAAPVTSVTVTNTTAADRPAGPATFGMIFAKGDIPRDLAVKDHVCQVDVKRRWPDGSIKHAIVTVALPKLPARARRRLEFTAVPTEPDDNIFELPIVPKELLGLELRFAIHKGPTRSVRLAKVVADAVEPTTWLKGPDVVEWHYKAAPAGPDGQADPDLEVRFHVRYYPQAKTARVTCVVENCHWHAPGNIPYDVTILRDGKEIYARKNVGEWPKQKAYLGHPKGARWVKRFWTGRRLGDVHVVYDLASWNRTRLIGRYDTTLVVPDKALDETAERWAKAPTDILQNGLIYPYFGATGGRPDLGPLPRWASRYVLSQDPRPLTATLGTADLAGGCPIHFRDEATDRYVSLDKHPDYSFNRAGSRKRIALRDTAETPWIMPAGSNFSPDAAHQASFAYVPYLVTGDYYYLEEMQFWADWNMVKQNWGYRQQARGLLMPDQVRGTAWALRQLVHAAALSPDNDPGKAYFEDKLAENLKYLNDFVAGRLDVKPTPIGTYTRGAGYAYTGMRWGKLDRKYKSVAGWMHNFLAWSLAHVADHGYSEAVAPRDYLMKWTIGSFTHPDQITPFVGTAYYLFVGQNDAEGKTRWYRSWKEVADGTFGPVEGEPKPSPPTKVSYSDYGGSYSYIARGVLLEALRAGRPGAAEALKWLEDMLPNRRKVLAADPTWAFER